MNSYEKGFNNALDLAISLVEEVIGDFDECSAIVCGLYASKKLYTCPQCKEQVTSLVDNYCEICYSNNQLNYGKHKYKKYP